MTSSAILPILFVSVLGSYIMDYIVTHRLVLKNDPDLIIYSTFVKFLSSFVFMLIGYTIFYEYTGSPIIAWFIGVPLGILFQVAFIGVLYMVIPVPNVTTRPLTFLY